ncbi:MAG: 3-phosphoshikimate 1-carboxyvinyltransferase [Planctomycetes bacterium]|nr:3-phosphoshikimate 1-carboxyvinyltransferase [Planctomycetota bacterium]
MKLLVQKSELSGPVLIPASKSHTIRAIVIASLADGQSTIRNPLDSLDTAAAVRCCRAFGAQIQREDEWTVHGIGGNLQTPDNVVDVANSGTTFYFLLGTAALLDGCCVITGDEQIRKRPAQPLIDSLNQLGADIFSTRGGGLAPVVVRGPLQGGFTTIEALTSQWVSSILISAPLAPSDTELYVTGLNERPYVQITLNWLESQGIVVFHENMEAFHIKGGQSYHGYDASVPGDFSSATFFLCAGALPGSQVLLQGLDMNDAQGDKAVVQMVTDMGAHVDVRENAIQISGSDLSGIEIDMNATPDALPAMSVVGCLAEGTTRLLNVPQARVKETDRISVMREELAKMDAHVEELPDGLVLHHSELHGARVDGHGDHRVVMALAVAGLAANGTTEIDGAEAMRITFPNFVDLMRSLGARIELRET